MEPSRPEDPLADSRLQCPAYHAASERPVPLLTVGPGQLPGLRAPDPAGAGGGPARRPAAELRERLCRAPPAQGPGARTGVPRDAPRCGPHRRRGASERPARLRGRHAPHRGGDAGGRGLRLPGRVLLGGLAGNRGLPGADRPALGARRLELPGAGHEAGAASPSGARAPALLLQPGARTDPAPRARPRVRRPRDPRARPHPPRRRDRLLPPGAPALRDRGGRPGRDRPLSLPPLLVLRLPGALRGPAGARGPRRARGRHPAEPGEAALRRRNQHPDRAGRDAPRNS